VSQHSIQIRTMSLDDLPAIVGIQGAIIQRPVSQTWTSALESEIQLDSSRCLVAETEGRVVGFIIAQIRYGEFGAERSGSLGYVGVSPKVMGQGVGRALAGALFEIFQSEGVEDIYTAVRWDSVDMLSFFKSLGFDRSSFINLRKRLS